MELSGKQVESLQIALMAAFSNDELRQMVRTKLDIPLEEITQHKDQGTVAFDLITWSERKGKLGVLVIGATEKNPANPILKAWRLKYELLIHLHHIALPAEQLQEIYTKSKPRNMLSVTSQIDFNQPDSVVDALWEMMPQPKKGYSSLPILEFALRLLPLTHKKDQLQAWVEEAFPLLASMLTQEDLQAMQKEIEAEANVEVQEPYAYLMVEVAPDAIYESERYDIEFTLWDTNGQERPIQPAHNELTQPVKKTDLSQVLPAN